MKKTSHPDPVLCSDQNGSFCLESGFGLMAKCGKKSACFSLISGFFVVLDSLAYLFWLKADPLFQGLEPVCLRFPFSPGGSLQTSKPLFLYSPALAYL